MDIIKVCVRIPASKKEKLLAIASEWRSSSGSSHRGPGWDAKAIHEIARARYGSLEGLFAEHGWDERGSDMMRQVQHRIKADYGTVDAFVSAHTDPRDT